MDATDGKVAMCYIFEINISFYAHLRNTVFSLAFIHGDDCWQVTREAFPESAADPTPSSRIKPISRGSYDRLEEFYAPVRTDCWPRD